MLVTVTHPQNKNLTDRDHVKSYMGETGSDLDTFVDNSIPVYSDAVKGVLGWDVVRGEFREEFTGGNKHYQVIPYTPVLTLEEVRYDDTAQTIAGEIEIQSKAGGIVYRRLGWWGTYVSDFVNDFHYNGANHRLLWDIRFYGGYLVRDDDFSSALIAFDGTGQTLTLSSGTWPLLVAGDRVTLSGATNSENSGTFTVASRTATVLTLESTSGIVTEAEGQTIAVTVRNLPDSIEQACAILISEAVRTRDGIGEIKSEKVGPLSRTYMEGNAATVNALADSVDHLLAPHRIVEL